MLTRVLQYSKFLTTCRRAAATICLCPGLQLKRAPAALSEAGRAGPDQPIRAIQPAAHAARRPDVRDRRQTDVREHHRLMPPGRGHNSLTIEACILQLTYTHVGST